MSKVELDTIMWRGLELSIEYTVEGKYLPATLEDPAEYPEITIVSIAYNGRDFSGLLDSFSLIAEITEILEQDIPPKLH